ncbi:MAG: hypothetical protein Q7J57_01775 [Gemmobacter sp.]|nr:hypothetical protein [Gemmobacter sp.]
MTPSLTTARTKSTTTLRLTLFLLFLSTQDVVNIVAVCLLIIAAYTVAFQKIDFLTLRMAWPILLLLVIGSLSVLNNQNFDTFAYSRDVVYVAKIPIIVMATIILCGKGCDEGVLFRAILYSAGILAVFYVATYYSVDGASLSRRELRLEVGRGYLLWSVSAFLIVAHKCILPDRALLRYIAKAFLLITIVLATQISTSRTLPLILFIFLFVWFGIRKVEAMKIMIVAALAVVIVFSFPPVYTVIGQALISTGIPFIVENVREMISTDFGSREQIQASFRSYEAFQAWNLFQGLPTFQMIFGAGFGTQIPLDTYVSLGISQNDQQIFQEVPISHISGMSVLLKCGWVGVVLYFYSVYPFLITERRNVGVTHTLNWALAIIYLYLNLVFQGIFSNLDLTMITVTLLVASRRIGFTEVKAPQSTIQQNA